MKKVTRRKFLKGSAVAAAGAYVATQAFDSAFTFFRRHPVSTIPWCSTRPGIGNRSTATNTPTTDPSRSCVLQTTLTCAVFAPHETVSSSGLSRTTTAVTTKTPQVTPQRSPGTAAASRVTRSIAGSTDRTDSEPRCYAPDGSSGRTTASHPFRTIQSCGFSIASTAAPRTNSFRWRPPKSMTTSRGVSKRSQQPTPVRRADAG